MAMDMESLTTLLEKFKNEIKSNLEDTIRIEIQKLNISQILEEQSKKCELVMEENRKLKEMLSRQNRQIEELRRKNNIVIFGIPEMKEENSQRLEDNILTLCDKTLGVEIDKTHLNYVRRIGPVREKKRPVLVSFLSNNMKRNIFQNRYKLKGTNIFISDDLDKEQQAQRKEMIQIRSKLKQQGIKDIKMRSNGLIIEGKFHHFSQMVQQSDLRQNNAEDEEEEEEEEEVGRELEMKTTERCDRASKKRKTCAKSPIQPHQKKDTILNFFRPIPQGGEQL